MFKKLASAAAAAALVIVPSAAPAASMGFDLHLIVPVQCSVNHQSPGSDAFSGGAFALGTFREYCNAAQGYQLIVRYAPGSLRGASVSAGGDTVVLDGSGSTVLSRTTGPRVRQRAIFITPGEHGFDTDRLTVDIEPL